MRTVMLGPALKVLDKKKQKRFSSPAALTNDSHLIVVAQTDVLGRILFTYPIPCRHYGGYCIKECIHLGFEYSGYLYKDEHRRWLTCAEEDNEHSRILGYLYGPKRDYVRLEDLNWALNHPLHEVK